MHLPELILLPSDRDPVTVRNPCTGGAPVYRLFNRQVTPLLFLRDSLNENVANLGLLNISLETFPQGNPRECPRDSLGIPRRSIHILISNNLLNLKTRSEVK